MFFNRIWPVLLLLVISMFVFTACDDEDDPLISTTHYEPYGVRFYSSGILMAEIFKGVTNDTLEVHEGETGDHLKMVFLDEDKAEMDPPTDEDKFFAYEIADPSIVSVWQHPGEEGSFEFHLVGNEHGETTIEVFVMHNDHPDYRSGKIPVVVEHEHGEFEAVGMVFYQNESQVASILRGVSSDSLVAPVNGISEDFDIKFYDEDGDIVDPPSDDEHTLGWTVDDESIVTVSQEEGKEGEFEFRLNGVNAGTTYITFTILHEGHSDFSSGKMKVVTE